MKKGIKRRKKYCKHMWAWFNENPHPFDRQLTIKVCIKCWKVKSPQRSHDEDREEISK